MAPSVFRNLGHEPKEQGGAAAEGVHEKCFQVVIVQQLASLATIAPLRDHTKGAVSIFTPPWVDQFVLIQYTEKREKRLAG